VVPADMAGLAGLATSVAQLARGDGSQLNAAVQDLQSGTPQLKPANTN
jgi:hypothetical protein